MLIVRVVVLRLPDLLREGRDGSIARAQRQVRKHARQHQGQSHCGGMRMVSWIALPYSDMLIAYCPCIYGTVAVVLSTYRLAYVMLAMFWC